VVREPGQAGRRARDGDGFVQGDVDDLALDALHVQFVEKYRWQDDISALLMYKVRTFQFY
jgi:hypothetical protein